MFNIEKPPLTKEEVENNRQIIETDIAVFKKKWVLLSLFFLAIGGISAVSFYLNDLVPFAVVVAVAVVVVVVVVGDGDGVGDGVGAVVGAVAGAVVVALAGAGTLVVVGISIDEKIDLYKQNLSDLLPIAGSDCPGLLKLGQTDEEIKKYLKSVADLDRMPTHGEYIMLKKYSENYITIKSQEIAEKEKRIACEAICSGEI